VSQHHISAASQIVSSCGLRGEPIPVSSFTGIGCALASGAVVSHNTGKLYAAKI
jgi:hypothetical protein